MDNEDKNLRTPVYPNMRNTFARKETFSKWPLTLRIKPRRFFEAGLFYTGESDRCRCFHCGGILSGWEQDDDPWIKHAELYPNCNFLKKQKGVNRIPVNATSDVQADAIGYQNDPQPEVGAARPKSIVSVSFEMACGSFDGRYPAMRDLIHRTSSFNGWNGSAKIEDLVAAGFYRNEKYLDSDVVFCFKCGGGLKDWGSQHDPFEHHAKNFGRCPYLLEVKNEEFFRNVFERYGEPQVAH